VAFAPSGLTLASGSYDNAIKLWDVKSGKLTHSLAGHTYSVWSVAFAPDGLTLASSSEDKQVIIWHLDSYYEPRVISFIHPSHSLLDVSFHPATSIAGTLGTTSTGDADIIINTIDLSAELAMASKLATNYISAKVVLVGESDVGKSSLALRLAENRYEDGMKSTHGMRIWTLPPEKLSAAAAAPPGQKREIFIWDLGGQEFYRLIHQLFIHDTTLALILFDPTRGAKAYNDVREWNQRLEKQLRGRQATKLLVGTKLDHDSKQINQVDIEALG
jgi:small GTP-binding protein